MGLRFPHQIYGKCFFITSTFKEWRKLGEIGGFYEALADSLIFYSNKYNTQIIGYVFMPSHVHFILIIDGAVLSNFMRDFKKFIGQKAASDLGLGKGGIWMPRYDRVEIHSEDILLTKLNYIHFNPVKDRLVGKPEDWLWSSAGEYILDRKGVIPIFRDWK